MWFACIGAGHYFAAGILADDYVYLVGSVTVDGCSACIPNRRSLLAVDQ